jgi:hypothetical protein
MPICSLNFVAIFFHNHNIGPRLESVFRRIRDGRIHFRLTWIGNFFGMFEVVLFADGEMRRHSPFQFLCWHSRIRVARFFLVQTYQNGKNIPNDHKLYQNVHKIYQIVLKHTNVFHSKALQNIPKFGYLVWKQTIWQPCSRLLW